MNRRTFGARSRSRLQLAAHVCAFALIATPAAAGAQATSSAPDQPVAPSSEAEDAGSDVTGAGTQTPAGSDAEAAAASENIVVTGSRIARSGFSAPTPVTVVGASRFEELAATNAGEVLAQLPSFRPTTSPTTQGVSIGTGGARTVDLRGLGAPRSLVLVDGRRFIASTANGSVDTNLIPSILIDRVELVTGGASAAYGSDAVAGVVNFILNNRLQGVRANVQAGISERGDDGERLFALAAGTSFAGGRGHVVVGGEYNDSDGIGGCYGYSLCAQEWQVLTNSGFATNGQPARIIANDVHTATQTYGGLINSPGPLRGIQFAPDGTPIPFVYGQFAGLFMQGGSGHGQNAFRSGGVIEVPVERYALYGHAEYEAGPATFFTDLSFGRVKVVTPGSQTRDTNLVMRVDNPYIPQSIRDQMVALAIPSITIGRVGQDLGLAMGLNTTETFRGAAGVDVELGNDWSADAYYQYGRTDAKQVVSNNRITANFNRAIDAVRGPDGNIVCRATLSPDPAVRAAAAGCVPLNLFGQYQWSQGAKDYTFGTSIQDTTLEQHVVAANVQGNLVDFGSGPVSVAFGGEYRREQISGTADPISLQNGFFVSNASAFDPSPVEVVEGYAETIVPLLRDLPMARRLELNAAARVTNYSTSGTVWTWKVGGVYEPVAGLRLRATRSRDIRAPNPSELFSPLAGLQTSVFDVVTNTQVLTRIFRGGNPDLDPEIADTFTVGAVLQPSFLPRLRLSVDYYDIKIEDAIDLVGAQTIADRCAAGGQEYCALIARDPVTNLIVSVTDQFLNVNQVKTRGIDIELDYVHRFDSGGTLAFRTLANRTFDLIQVDSTGAIDRAGQTGRQVSGPIGVPKYTIDSTLSYDQGPYGVTLQGRYIPSGSYDASLIGPHDPDYSPTLPNSINDNTVDDFLTFNLTARFTVGSEDSRKIQFFMAVTNLFDVDPPLAPGNAYTNPIFFDQTGRGYRAGARLTF